MKTTKTPPLVSLAALVEWLAVALVFAFVFRGFVVEAFKIPTGSMAPTLRGDHYEVACIQCGYKYDVNHTNGNRQEQQMAYRCPSCGNMQRLYAGMVGGDRILVYKSMYNFKDPVRWDVIVFKNPTEPQINYIKRAVGLPGETVQIIDGDVFIDGKIARKPPKVQQELWMPVYDGDHIPARPSDKTFAKGQWKVPFVMDKGWSYEDGGATFILDSYSETDLTYDIHTGNDFRATYAYNPSVYYHSAEESSDLRVKFWVKDINKKSVVGAKIYKYGRQYIAKADFGNSLMQLYSHHDGKEQLLAERKLSGEIPTKSVMFEFDNADYRLTFNLGKYSLVEDIGSSYGEIGTYDQGKAAVVITGKGEFAINHVTLDRDIHYYSRGMDDNQHIRGTLEHPITLGEDEFFACGDNSPASFDSRMWDHPGIGNSGREYPIGVVPRDYLMGQAFFVYWPGSYRTKPRGGIPLIPNVGMMRWIYGGHDEDLSFQTQTD